MTDATRLKPEFVVKDEQELRALFPPTHSIAVEKCQNRLDPYAKQFIERSPFVCLGTQALDGTADVSPRGDPAGFVKVLDETTLLIPDRPGNNRLDTQSNLLTNPSVGLLFLIPGFDDTLRVNGAATLTRDPDLLAMLTVQGKTPRVAIVVSVEEVFLHCAKAFRRAKLWDQSQHQDRKTMPSLAQMIHEQTAKPPLLADEIKAMNNALEDEYQKTMY